MQEIDFFNLNLVMKPIKRLLTQQAAAAPSNYTTRNKTLTNIFITKI